ncbi:MAG: MoxR family ATPase [Myxococcales bacterium]|nr:MoxR family ATPase [Myxococcales bacterium]
MPGTRDQSVLHDFHQALEATVYEVGTVVRGKDEVVRLSLIALLAKGHILLEDVPGVGKTTLARALARVIGGEFARIQLTADLLPVDIVGSPVVEADGHNTRFRPGPIFANVVLADELNRATPRAQSGLLEAMAEGAVSVDGISHPLPAPFYVIATQNPFEHHGTYALPQSQMDRFLFRTALGYPDMSIERGLLVGDEPPPPPESLNPRLTVSQLSRLWSAVDQVTMAPEVAEYIQAMVMATRESPEVDIGVSTRGLLLYARAVRARALVCGRAYVSPEDVYVLAVPVCAHRVVLKGAGSESPSRARAEAYIEVLRQRVPGPAW